MEIIITHGSEIIKTYDITLEAGDDVVQIIPASVFVKSTEGMLFEAVYEGMGATEDGTTVELYNALSEEGLDILSQDPANDVLSGAIAWANGDGADVVKEYTDPALKPQNLKFVLKKAAGGVDTATLKLFIKAL